MIDIFLDSVRFIMRLSIVLMSIVEVYTIARRPTGRRRKILAVGIVPP